MADNLVILGAGKQGVNRHAAKMRLRGAENIREMLWKFLNRQLRAGQITPPRSGSDSGGGADAMRKPPGRATTHRATTS